MSPPLSGTCASRSTRLLCPHAKKQLPKTDSSLLEAYSPIKPPPHAPSTLETVSLGHYQQLPRPRPPAFPLTLSLLSSVGTSPPYSVQHLSPCNSLAWSLIAQSNQQRHYSSPWRAGLVNSLQTSPFHPFFQIHISLLSARPACFFLLFVVLYQSDSFSTQTLLHARTLSLLLSACRCNGKFWSKGSSSKSRVGEIAYMMDTRGGVKAEVRTERVCRCLSGCGVQRCAGMRCRQGGRSVRRSCSRDEGKMKARGETE